MGHRDGSLRSCDAASTWTEADVVALMDQLDPPGVGSTCDCFQQQRRLCRSFAAGAALMQDERLPPAGGCLAAASLQTARALLKNRAASQHCRMWHAFIAGSLWSQRQTHHGSGGWRCGLGSCNTRANRFTSRDLDFAVVTTTWITLDAELLEIQASLQQAAEKAPLPHGIEHMPSLDRYVH